MPMICIKFSGVSGSIEPPASSRWITSAQRWVEGGIKGVGAAAGAVAVGVLIGGRK